MNRVIAKPCYNKQCYKEVVVVDKVLYEPYQAKKCLQTCICAVGSGPLLSASRIIGYYRIYEWRAKARLILDADDLNCAFCVLKALFCLMQPHLFQYERNWSKLNTRQGGKGGKEPLRKTRLQIKQMGENVKDRMEYSWADDIYGINTYHTLGKLSR